MLLFFFATYLNLMLDLMPHSFPSTSILVNFCARTDLNFRTARCSCNLIVIVSIPISLFMQFSLHRFLLHPSRDIDIFGHLVHPTFTYVPFPCPSSRPPSFHPLPDSSSQRVRDWYDVGGVVPRVVTLDATVPRVMVPGVMIAGGAALPCVAWPLCCC